jgi:hypothetical protein
MKRQPFNDREFSLLVAISTQTGVSATLISNEPSQRCEEISTATVEHEGLFWKTRLTDLVRHCGGGGWLMFVRPEAVDG